MMITTNNSTPNKPARFSTYKERRQLVDRLHAIQDNHDTSIILFQVVGWLSVDSSDNFWEVLEKYVIERENKQSRLFPILSKESEDIIKTIAQPTDLTTK